MEQEARDKLDRIRTDIDTFFAAISSADLPLSESAGQTMLEAAVQGLPANLEAADLRLAQIRYSESKERPWVVRLDQNDLTEPYHCTGEGVGQTIRGSAVYALAVERIRARRAARPRRVPEWVTVERVLCAALVVVLLVLLYLEGAS